MPLFLERRSYRFRRMMDAVRFLPFFGLGLWMIPLMWSVPDATATADAGMSMSRALVFVFGVWLALICAALLLWRHTRGGVDPATPKSDPS